MSKIKNILTVIKEKWKPHFVFAILAFMLYANTLNNYFVLDDGIVLTHNQFTQQGIKGIPAILKYNSFIGHWINKADLQTSQNLMKEMKIVVGDRYRPLSLVTFALEVEFFGKENILPNSHNDRFLGNAFISHLINILLFLFTACLLYSILTRLSLTGKDKNWFFSLSFIVTILFLAHPIHTEVVANIKGRDEIMALLGSLGALWFSINYIESNKFRYLLWSGLSLFLGMMSKENAITFLAVIPVTLYYFKTRTIRKILISLFPLIVASSLFLLIRAIVLGVSFEPSDSENTLLSPFAEATVIQHFATIFYTLFLYIKLLVYPHPLTYEYSPYHIEIATLSNPIVLLSLLFYAGIGIYAVYGLIKKREVVSWSIWLYLLPLSVVSNIFFPTGAFMNERFVYFSSIGFVVFIGWLIVTYVPKIRLPISFGGKRSNTKLTRYLTSAVLVMIFCLYAAKTISRNRVWKDNFTLYITDAKTSENSIQASFMAGSAYLQIAMYPDNEDEALLRNEYCDKAAQYLELTRQLQPYSYDVIVQLGNLYWSCYKDVAKSLHYFAQALQIPTLLNDEIIKAVKQILTFTHALLDDNQVASTPEDILQSCDELLSVHPDMGEAIYLKGIIYGKFLHNTGLALVNFQNALTMDFPKTAEFYEYLGTAYGISGNYQEAIVYLLKAVESGTNDYNTFINLGLIFQQLGDKENAQIYMSKGNEMKNK